MPADISPVGAKMEAFLATPTLKAMVLEKLGLYDATKGRSEKDSSLGSWHIELIPRMPSQGK